MAGKKTVARKVTAPKKTTVSKKSYIVVWDNDDGDPVRVFNNIDDAKRFCIGLVTHNESFVNNTDGDEDWIDLEEVVRDSVKLYEGTLLGKAEVSVTFK